MKLNRHPLITSLNAPVVADKEGIRRFAEAMNKKMGTKRRAGKRGWNTTRYSGWGCSVRELESMLREHLAKGDVVDVANFCMMIWNRRNPRGLP